jgi:hypothetical protein
MAIFNKTMQLNDNKMLCVIQNYPEIKPVMAFVTKKFGNYVLQNDMVSVEVSGIISKGPHYIMDVIDEIAFLMQTIDHPKRNQ